LIPAYLWTPYIWSIFIDQLPIARSRATAHEFRDFLHFYMLGLLTRVRAASLLYNPEAQRRLMQQVVPSAPDLMIPTSWGPQAGFIFAPISGGSYVQALLWWLTISIGGYLVCLYAMWRLCPHLRGHAWPVAVLALGLPAFHVNLMYAQTGTLELAWSILFYAALRDPTHAAHQLTKSPTRQVVAGLVLGLLFVKPHLGVGAGVLVLAAGQWWIAAGAAVTIAGQLAASAFYWGPRILLDYGHALLRIPGTFQMIEPDLRQIHEWRAFFQLMGLHGAALTMATGIADLTTLAAAVVCWRSPADLRLKYAVLLVSTMIVSPHAYTYDMLLLLPAGLLIWDFIVETEGREGRRRLVTALRALVLLAYLSPLLGLGAYVLHFQPSMIVFAISLAVLMRLNPVRRQQYESI
jgi:hypothetical protein